jgi:dihydrofolate reductase
MCRKTFDSIGKKALQNRTNIVVCHNTEIEQTEHIKRAGSLDEALQLANFIN